MERRLTHPLAKHPIDCLNGRFSECSFSSENRAYLNSMMLEASLRLCTPYVKGQLLDVGCGSRPYQETYFAPAETYVGVDYPTPRSRPDVVSSALGLPFKDECFDTVVSTEVLEHVPDPLRALTEMHRVLRPDGFLILTAPMHWPRHEVPHDYFRHTYDGLIYLFRQSGFEIVTMFNRGRSYAFLGQVIQHFQPVPFAWFSRLVNYFFLWCDLHFKNDALTLGWTIVAKRIAA